MRTFLRRLGHSLARDAIDDVGAMMAYYAILAVFPMLLFVVTMAALVVPATTIAEATRFALEAVPSSARSLIESQVHSLTQHARAGFALGSVVFAVWGASRGASGLMHSLNRLFGKVETRSWLHRQAIAITLTVGLAALLLIALGVLVVGPIIGHVVANRLGLGSLFDVGWTVSRWLVAALLVMVVWALAFRFLPDTHEPIRIFTPGAFAGVVLWLVISRLFGLYLEHFTSYTSIYGALGSAIILLTWLWLSSMSLLFAAEVNAVLADLRSRRAVSRRVGGQLGANLSSLDSSSAPRA
jgi:membrane protein